MPLPARRALPAALLLGALAACGFAPIGAWPLTLACFAALLALLERATTARRALALGWWFGVGHFCVGNNWIATAFTFQAAMPAWLGWIAVVLLSLYLAVFPMLATGAAWLLVRRGGRIGLLLAAVWIATEWLRATLFTGFAWNPLAAIWAALWPVAGVVAYVGTYGLSGLTVALAAALLAAGRYLVAEVLRAAPERRRQRALIVGGIGVAVATGVASLAVPLATVPPPLPTAGVRLRIVQPDINQAEKWQAGFQARNHARLLALTGAPGDEPRLVLWPEVAIPEFLEEEPGVRMALARLLGPRDVLLTGGEALRYGPDGGVVAATNSVFALDARGRLLGRYDKSHLVPYGEYLPMRPLLSRLGLSRLAPGDMDFDAGPGPRDLPVPGLGTAGVQICYEIIFSGHVVDEAHRPRFLFNPSNDAWFGRWGPPQHLAQARLRAMEEGLPIVRSTPTGISALIDGRGRLLASVPWHRAGAIDARLPPPLPPTLFARWGNLLPLGLLLLLGIAAFALRRRPG